MDYCCLRGVRGETAYYTRMRALVFIFVCNFALCEVDRIAFYTDWYHFLYLLYAPREHE